MRDQVELLKRPGFSAATKGIGEESDGNEEKIAFAFRKIVFGSPESWLPKLWMKELEEKKLGQPTVAVALDEVPLSVIVVRLGPSSLEYSSSTLESYKTRDSLSV